MSLTIKNNYSSFKQDFRKDTGLDPEKSIETYIAYYNARINDHNMQFNAAMLNEIANLPGRLSFELKQIN
ncbi:MAG: hypothetical protein ACLFVR_07155 [Thiohalospira sp.]